MSTTIVELEKVLQKMVLDHRNLLNQVQVHQEAMKKFKVEEMSATGEAIESIRKQILATESRRRALVQQVARLHKLPANASLSEIAGAVPQYKASLLKLRDELKFLTAQISRKTTVSSKVAGTLLGHLNTVVRLIAGAVQQAAVYTKQGMPPTNARIGVMEAVG